MSLVHAAARLLLSLMPVFICVPAIWASAVLLIRPMRGGILRNPRLIGLIIALLSGIYLFLIMTMEPMRLIAIAPLLSLCTIGWTAALFAAVTDRAYRTSFNAIFFQPDREQPSRWAAYFSIGVAVLAIGGAITTQHLIPCGALDRTIRLSGCRAAIFINTETFVSELAVAPGVSALIVNSSTSDERLRVEVIQIDRPSQSLLLSTPESANRPYVADIVMSASHSYIAARTYDSQCYIWDAQSGALLQAIEPTEEDQGVVQVALSPRGALAAIARHNGEVALLRPPHDAGEVIVQTVDPARIAFSSDGAYLAISSAAGTIIWDVGAGAALEHMTASGEPIWSLSGAGLMIIGDQQVTVAEVGAGASAPLVRQVNASQVRGAFAPDGTPLIIESQWSNRRQVSTVSVRDLRTDRLVLTLTIDKLYFWGIDGVSRTFYYSESSLPRAPLMLYDIPAAAPAP